MNLEEFIEREVGKFSSDTDRKETFLYSLMKILLPLTFAAVYIYCYTKGLGWIGGLFIAMLNFIGIAMGIMIISPLLLTIAFPILKWMNSKYIE